MGNALTFQQKFENIALAEETQNYQSVYLEYGDLFHDILDFEPLEDSALRKIESYTRERLIESKLLDNF